MHGSRFVAFSVAETADVICTCAEAGIAGFVSRDGSKEDLVAAVENAVRGEVVCTPRMAASLFKRLAAVIRATGQAGPPATLTGRERDIIAHIDRGLSNKDIARQLKISTATVKNHVHNILEKLQVRRRGEAAAVLRETADDRSRLRHPPKLRKFHEATAPVIPDCVSASNIGSNAPLVTITSPSHR